MYSYKGYKSLGVFFDKNTNMYFGKIDNINRNLINFVCEDETDGEKEFKDAVDCYLEFCNETVELPDDVNLMRI